MRLPLFAGAGLVATAWESSGGALPCCFWHELTGTKSINRTCVLVVFSWCAIGLGRYVRNCIFQFHYRSVYLAIIQGDPLSTKLTKENCKRDGMWNFHICALPFWTYSHMFLLANHRRSFFLTEGTAEHDLSDHLGWLKDRGPKNNAWMVMGTGTCKNMGMIRGDVHTSSFRSDSKQLTAGAF